MKESEIRPQKLFNQYLQLAKKDNEIFFSDHSRFISLHDHRPRCMICITARPNR
jgi:hypothetical protein